MALSDQQLLNALSQTPFAESSELAGAMETEDYATREAVGLGNK